MSRSFLRGVVLDTDGEPIVGATVQLYELGTVTPLPEPLYANSVSLTPIPSAQQTNALGEYEYWMDGLGRHCTVQASGVSIPSPQREAGAFVMDGRDVPDQGDVNGLSARVGALETQVDGLAGEVTDLTAASDELVEDMTDVQANVGYLQTFHNVKWHGAIGDGALHPLSSRFGTLAAAQAVYPHATALTNQLDWAAAQGAVAAAEAQKGGTVYWPPGGEYLHDQTLRIRKGVMLQGVMSDNDTAGSGSGVEATIIRWVGADSGTLIRVEAAAPSNYVTGGGIDQLLLDGYNTSALVAQTLVYLKGTQHHRIGRVKLRNVRVQGILYDNQPTVKSVSNTIDDLDFSHGFSNPGGIGDNACGVVFNGSTEVPANTGVTLNLINRIRGVYYNGDLVRFRFADNNLIHHVHAIPAAGGSGMAVRFATVSGDTGHAAYGFPAGNIVGFVNGNVHAEGFTHGNRIDHHLSEGGRITLAVPSQLHYEAMDYANLMLHETHRYTMTDVYPVPAGALMPGAGVVASQVASLWGGWALPDSANGRVMGFAHPYAWGDGIVTGCRVHYALAASSPGGTIRLRFMATSTGAPGLTPPEVSVIETVVVHGSAELHETVDLECSLGHVRGEGIAFLVEREPLDAADTVAGAVLIYGVDLLYASTGPTSTGGVGPYTPNPPPYSPF